MREARPRGFQQSALLQRPQEASEEETRSVEALTVGSLVANTPLPSAKHLGAFMEESQDPPLPFWPSFSHNFQLDFSHPLSANSFLPHIQENTLYLDETTV